jgi:glycolate oxidase
LTDAAWLAELQEILPGARIATHPATLAGLRRDQAATIDAGMPAAVAFPVTTDEVSAMLRLASRRGVPVVPRGAGSGLAGGANATDGCLVLSLARMDRILEIDRDDLVAVVQPGVLNGRLASAVAEIGLSYAPDPSSFEISSIGGNLATNAGGLRCLKYGVTRDAALALEVVLADGRVLRTGHRSVKGVAGLDLVSLFVGSEGTLGVITEATLRLRPALPAAGTLLAAFPTPDAAGEAAAGILQLGIAPSVLELIDAVTVDAIEAWRGVGLPRASTLIIVRCDGPDEGRAALLRAEETCRAAGAIELLRSTDVHESEGLMEARRAALPALERRGVTMLEDVAVPLSRIGDLLRAVQRIAGEHDVVVGTFGHAGDGNLHPTIVVPRGDDRSLLRTAAAASAILEATIALGGTITGEHGIGLLKRTDLSRELGEVGVAVTRSVKAALDPLGILNPGKLIP